MISLSESVSCSPILFAQQGDKPLYGHNKAYEEGKKVGQITAWVILGVIALAVGVKVFRMMFRKD